MLLIFPTRVGLVGSLDEVAAVIRGARRRTLENRPVAAPSNIIEVPIWLSAPSDQSPLEDQGLLGLHEMTPRNSLQPLPPACVRTRSHCFARLESALTCG